MVCQFDKEYVENLGLVKLDLLSLRTLSAMEDAVADIARRGIAEWQGDATTQEGAFKYDAPPTTPRRWP